MDEALTPEEQEALDEAIATQFPKQKEEFSHFAYFKNVIRAIENIKTGNLNSDEIGFVKLPVRTNLEIAQYCKGMGMAGFSEYFKDEAQILLATSLSKEGFLNNLAVTQKRESQTSVRSTPPRTRKGLFRKRNKEEEIQQM